MFIATVILISILTVTVIVKNYTAGRQGFCHLDLFRMVISI